MPLIRVSLNQLTPFIFIISCFISSCTLPRILRHADKKQEITIQPEPLAASGDEVTFELKARVPQRLVNKKYPYKVDVYYAYGENKRENIATLNFQFGEFLYENKKPTITKTLAFAYTPAKRNGHLMVQGRAMDAKTEQVVYAEPKRLASGILTTPLSVVKDNQVLYIPSAYNPDDHTKEHLEFFFEKDEHQLRNYVGSNLQSLDQYIMDNVEAQQISVSGSQSPDEAGQGLAARRAAELKQYYQQKVEMLDYSGKKVTITTDDAADLQEQLATKVKQSALPKKQVAEILAVIGKRGSLTAMATSLQHTQAYPYLQRYIYPSLRTARAEINYKRSRKPDYRLYLLAQKIADQKAAPDQLTADELLYAATLTPLLSERKKLFEASVKLTDKWPAYFNLGVVYLQMADKEYRPAVQHRLLDSAIHHLSYAGYRNPTAAVHYGLGSARHVRGDKPKALESYNYAIRMGGDSTLLTRIFADKAALEIEMGLYDEAIASLRYAGDSYQTQMNLGLSYLLKENHEGAERFYQLALQHKPNDARAHYFLAVVAARSKQEQMLAEHLRRAIRSNQALIKEAVEDLEFRDYHRTRFFQEALLP
ncbi:tetratricopeptide repeat protein [Pontibacter beigongshangensis]|uniref:tetratricopeptide repeat protein n=1 Tax=Pontibacter beigongshangensis TaxID=2574733 RepID=UPI00164FB489|nr:tetratricopeptide repeat protein [Pontibacter beigongshangensis]